MSTIIGRIKAYFSVHSYQEGQMLLIVVLVMVVVLTVGLSVATRSITNLRSTTEEENSQRAFSAAEAGVELALKTGSASGSFTNNATYTANVAVLGQSISFPVNNGEIVSKDEGVDIWLSNYPSYSSPWSGSFTIYWGSSSDVCDPNESTNTAAALEVIVLSGSTSSPTVSHYAVDPCSQRRAANAFSPPGAGGPVLGTTYPESVTISGVTNGLIARVIPVYATAKMAVTSTVALPAQGQTVTSTGTSDTSERKLTLFEGYPKVPTELFPFVVFSPK